MNRYMGRSACSGGALLAFRRPAQRPGQRLEDARRHPQPRPARLRRVDRRGRVLAAGQPGRDGRASTPIPAARSPPRCWATRNKIRFVPTTTTNRFTALQSGEIDVLVRSTTWTLGREANLGLEFAGVNFYDGTGFLVKTALGVKSAKELDGATICVQPGTSTELAIADYFRQQQPEVHADPDPGPVRNPEHVPLRPLRRLLDRHVGRWPSFRFQQGRRRTTSCCCRRSSARSRSA